MINRTYELHKQGRLHEVRLQVEYIFEENKLLKLKLELAKQELSLYKAGLIK